MSRRSATTIKVFVGSLPAGTTVDELKELFSPYGEIAECDVVNRCGFLHLEDKALAHKAIDELNNTTFKGTRISVEKGRVKPMNRDRGGPMGGRGGRNGFGPMRGGRDNYRSGPYMRDGDFDRRGPPRGGFGGGFDRGFSGRPGPMGDGYGERRPFMSDRSGGYGGGFGDQGYGNGGGDNMYNSNNGYFNGGSRGGPFERRSMMDDRKPMDDRMGDRRPMSMMGERRPLMDSFSQGGMGGPSSMGFDRRPPQDMYSRRDGPPKPMGGGGYGDSAYDTAYPPIQNRSYIGGPGPRRDMPPMRRF